LNDCSQYACDLVNTFPQDMSSAGNKNRREAMTDETRKEQEKKDELTEKDLDKASGGGSIQEHGTERAHHDQVFGDQGKR
jgi:hypothetical protein